MYRPRSVSAKTVAIKHYYWIACHSKGWPRQLGLFAWQDVVRRKMYIYEDSVLSIGCIIVLKIWRPPHRHTEKAPVMRKVFQCRDGISHVIDIIEFTMNTTLQWRLKSPASRLFTQPLIQAQITENIKAPRHWPTGNSPVTAEFPA